MGLEKESSERETLVLSWRGGYGTWEGLRWGTEMLGKDGVTGCVSEGADGFEGRQGISILCVYIAK